MPRNYQNPIYKQSGGFIQIDISDSGVGIENKDIQKIFEPLFTTKASGTGLGLSICQEIISKHGGKITVVTELNKGTTFSIFLPAQ